MKVDVIVIGAGQAGPPLAARLAEAGRRVLIAEAKDLGGTCVNNGCTPTKTMIASARAAHVARTAGRLGVRTGDVKVDLAAVVDRKDKIVRQWRESVQKRLDKAGERLTLIRGRARLVAAREIEVDGERHSADVVVLNVGCRAMIPPIPGLAETPHLDNASVMELREVPRKLVVLGGGYIGCEFAQMFRRFGSEVTIVESMDRLMSHEDPESSAALRGVFESEGIELALGAKAASVSGTADDLRVRLDSGREVTGSHLLVALGRRPNTDDLGLEAAGVQTDARGNVVVDDQCRTNVDHIWAMGDCNGKGAFTHTSYNDFEIVAANLLDNDQRRISDRVPTYALYIDPPLGRAGLTVDQVRESGRKALVGKRPMTRVGRAVEKGETQGFMKVVVDAETEEILGAAILGVGGDEVIHSILDIMSAKDPYTSISRTMHIHPTVSELVPTMLQEMTPLDRDSAAG